MGIYGPSGLSQRGSQARNLLCKPTRPLKREQLLQAYAFDKIATTCCIVRYSRRTETGRRSQINPTWWHHLADSRVATTQRAHSMDWVAWTEWARSNGVSEIPASGSSIVAYLPELVTTGASDSTIKAAKTAISFRHRDAGFCDPTLVGSIDHGPTVPNDPLETLDMGEEPTRLCSQTTGPTHRVPSKFLRDLRRRQTPSYSTDFGEAWVGDSRKLLKKIDSESIDLMITSPPYGLVKKKHTATKAKKTMSDGFARSLRRSIGS